MSGEEEREEELGFAGAAVEALDIRKGPRFRGRGREMRRYLSPVISVM